MTTSNWLSDLHARGLLPVLRTALDLVEPLGPLGAQMLYLIQPAAGLFGGSWRQAVDAIGQALEMPDGLHELRAQIDQIDAPDGC
ncbi:MAG: hypothetical protein ACUVS2_12830 [Candidatus Flexifilum sp.]|jgi:hypothetical protein